MNNSCNYGVEGPTRRQSVQSLRTRQVRNFLSTLFLSQGVPMLLSGDECRRTQQGNNNAYCQDNELSWFDWNLVDKNADLARFCRGLIAFRLRQPTVRRATFLLGEPAEPGLLPDVSWFSPDGGEVNWTGDEQSLVCLFGAWPTTGPSATSARHVLIFTHAGPHPREFVIPPAARNIEWRLFINTAAESPDDIYPDADGPAPADHKLLLSEHSLACYVAA